MTGPDQHRVSAHTHEILRRVQVWSRTIATGVIDTSTSAEKAAVLAAAQPGEQRQTTTKAVGRFRDAIRAGCELLEDATLSDLTPALLTELNGVVAGSELGGRTRTHEKSEYGYLASGLIVFNMDAFCERIRSQSFANSDDPDVAGLLFDVHWSVNLHGHYFMDGCGRTALLLGSWLTIALQGCLLPLPTRTEYLNIASHPEPETEWRRLLAKGE